MRSAPTDKSVEMLVTTEKHLGEMIPVMNAEIAELGPSWERNYQLMTTMALYTIVLELLARRS